MDEEKKPIDDNIKNAMAQAGQIAKSLSGSNFDYTPDEVYRIMAGKGVEYKTASGEIVYLPPLLVRDMLALQEMYNFLPAITEHRSGDALKKLVNMISEYTSTSEKFINNNCDLNDLVKMIGLMGHVVSEGKDLYKKKEITVRSRPLKLAEILEMYL